MVKKKYETPELEVEKFTICCGDVLSDPGFENGTGNSGGDYGDEFEF